VNRVSTRTLAALLALCLGLSAVGASTVALSVEEASADDAADSSADVTYVEDNIAEDTTWTAEEGPYRIAADITVEEGATLVVEPGTTVQPASDISITVEGNLSAEGTAEAPISVSPAPQAPDRVRWATIRYEGSSQSSLSLAHVTLERATNALTVGSSVGRIDVDEATVRTVSENGIRVVDDAGTPALTVEDSTFTDIGERGVAVTPGMGAVGESSVTSNSSEPGNRTEHQLALTPGADVTMDTFRVSYRGHGNVDEVKRESLRAFGLDLNGDGTVDRSLLPLVASVGTPQSNAYEIRLGRAVIVPADAAVRVAYNDTVNPRTYGTYPVAVDFRTNGVSQTATTTLPFDLRSSGESPDQHSAESRATRVSVTGSTFESIGQQGVFVAADVTRRVRIAGNTFSNSRGSGISLRGRAVDSITVDRNRISAVGPDADGVRVATRRTSNADLRKNRISEADAGIGLYVRNENADGIRVTGNTVTDSTTGVRVRQRVSYYAHHFSMTLADNTVSNNDRHGVSVVTDSTRLRAVTVRDNTITGNGETGLLLDGNTLSRIAVRDNVVEDNDDGLRIRADRFVNSRVVNNTIAENRGHGLSARTSLVVHNVSIADNRALDNAGIGLNVDNQLTHAGAVTLTRNVVAANAYGIRLAGAFGGRIRNNTVVYNTYGLDAPTRVGEYRPGTGIIVEEGEAGAIFRTGEVSEALVELVDDPEVESQLEGRPPDEYTVVLRPNRSGYVWKGNDSALAVRSLSEDLPTGVVLGKADENRHGVVVSENDVYGHDRGMTVDVETLVDANTTTRLFVDATRTVVAERNYWGAEDGPTHASIHPEGTGDRIVTRSGWVDFVPVASSPFGPRYHRPVANVSVSPSAATVGDSVVVSGRASSDADGRVATYRFVVAGPDGNRIASSPIRSASPNATVSVAETGRYTVSLVVADEMGIESADSATETVTVRERGATTTASSEPESESAAESASGTATASTNATTSTNTTAQPPATAETGLFSGSALFTTLGGLLGFVFYGAALALGGFGVVQTVRQEGVPVSGRTINALAGAGVLVWVGSGLLGTEGLLAVGVGGGALWGALVALLWVTMG
jgi:parallel beta-helix repeat protein